MEKEISDDSYCTTDEGEKDEKNSNNSFLENEEEEKSQKIKPKEFDEEQGKIINIKENNFIKEIIQPGEGDSKPIEIDFVIASIKTFLPNGEIMSYFTFENREFSLEGNNIPKAIKMAIISMKKNEISKFQIKANYIFKHFINYNIPFPSQIIDEEVRKSISKEKLIFEIHLTDYFIVQNIMDEGEIKKKTIKGGENSSNTRLSNKVLFSMRCFYRNQEIYKRISEEISIDNNDFEIVNKNGIEIKKYKLFDIERRIILSMKLNEKAIITVKPSYMLEKNKEFLEIYEIIYKKSNNFDEEVNKIMSNIGKSNQEILFQNREKFALFNEITENYLRFDCEIQNLEKYEYIFKPEKDSQSKKLIVNKGFGKDSPDRESFALVNFLIKIDNQIIFNSFSKDILNINEITDDPYRISEVFNVSLINKEIKDFRMEINKKHNIQLDMDLEYDRDVSVYREMESEFHKTLNIDLRVYSIPIILRKVLIHMKRGELAYINTKYIDYFGQNDCEIIDKNANIKIYVHLYDFLHRKIFSKMTLEEKYDDLSNLKELANGFFKAGKLFRACKIYQNINYRFNFGDVFGMIFEENELPIKKKYPELYKKLNEIRISCHNNLASAKLKQGKFYSAYVTADKVITTFDKENQKSLYIKGFTAIKLNFIEDALDALQTLLKIAPENTDFKNLYLEAQNISKVNVKKQKNMYRKMLFSSD